MGAGVVNNDQIAFVDRGQIALDGEFVVVLAKRPDHVDRPARRRVQLGRHGDVMIGAVHARSHQGLHRGVHTDVCAIDVLAVDGPHDQHSVRSGHVASAFHVKLRPVAVFRLEILQHGRYLCGHVFQVERLLLRPIGDAQAPSHVDELETDIQPAGYLCDQRQQHLHGFNHVLVVELVGGDHRVHAEPAGAAFGRQPVRVENLIVGQSVFGLHRVADDEVAGAFRAGVVAEADQSGHFRNLGNQGDVVQVQQAPSVCGSRGKLGGAGVVGGEHDVLRARTDPAAQHQFGRGAAVESEPHGLHDP